MNPAVRRYVGAVIAAGAAASAATTAAWGLPAPGRPGVLVLLAALVAVTERFPLLLVQDREGEGLALSELFVVALLLLAPPGPALAAYVSGIALAELTRIAQPAKIAFNVAQFALSFAFAATVAHLAGDPMAGGPAALVAAGAGGLVHFAANHALVAGVVARAEGRSVAGALGTGWRLRLFTLAGNLSLGVLMGLVGDAHPWALPVAVVPVGLLHASFAAQHRALRAGEEIRRLLVHSDAERHRYENLVAASSDGIIAADPAGLVVSWSPAMERLTGVAASSAVGLPLDAVLWDAGVGDQYVALLPATGTAAPPAPVEIGVGIGRGEPRWLSCAVSDVPGGGWLVVARDVTAQHEIEELRSDFVATVSHELRTPLTPIKGFVEAMLRRPDAFDADERRSMLEAVKRQTGRLERLVMDLLDSTVLGRPQPPRLERQRVSVPAVCADVVATFTAQAPDRRFLVDIPDSLPTVLADEQRVVQVLANLVSNALRYSPEGTPVQVQARASSDFVSLTVVDEGPGVAPADRERIFERFSRLGDHLHRPSGGVGLGLYIARELVTAMGGTIGVDAAPGGGAAFTFSLPVRCERDDCPDATGAGDARAPARTGS